MTEQEVVDKPLIMSVSRYSEYTECPYRYYLHRVEKAWQRPAAWFAQGSGFHEVPEANELSGRTMTVEDMVKLYDQAYTKYINEALDTTPNTNFWFASGPYRCTLSGDPRTDDIARRRGIGAEQVGKYAEWVDKHPEEKPWIAPATGDQDAQTAVELPFETDFGGVPVRGYIDWVDSKGKVRDWKTGNRAGNPLQLETYKVAVEKQYDFEIHSGDFWMGKSGKPTIELDLTDVTEEQLADKYGAAYDDILAEKYDPNPSKENCQMCSVALSCPFAY